MVARQLAAQANRTDGEPHVGIAASGKRARRNWMNWLAKHSVLFVPGLEPPGHCICTRTTVKAAKTEGVNRPRI